MLLAQCGQTANHIIRKSKKAIYIANPLKPFEVNNSDQPKYNYCNNHKVDFITKTFITNIIGRSKRH